MFALPCVFHQRLFHVLLLPDRCGEWVQFESIGPNFCIHNFFNSLRCLRHSPHSDFTSLSSLLLSWQLLFRLRKKYVRGGLELGLRDAGLEVDSVFFGQVGWEPFSQIFMNQQRLRHLLLLLKLLVAVFHSNGDLVKFLFRYLFQLLGGG